MDATASGRHESGTMGGCGSVGCHGNRPSYGDNRWHLEGRRDTGSVADCGRRWTNQLVEVCIATPNATPQGIKNNSNDHINICNIRHTCSLHFLNTVCRSIEIVRMLESYSNSRT